MSVQVTAPGLVSVEVLINALVGDRRQVVFFEVAGDLFRRPVPAQEGVNLLPGRRFDAGGILLCLTTVLGFLLSLLWAIATLAEIAA